MCVALKHVFNFPPIGYLIQLTAQLLRKVSGGMGTNDRRMEWTLLKETRSWFSESKNLYVGCSDISAPLSFFLAVVWVLLYLIED